MLHGRKHGFCFSANSPYSNELIRNVDFPDFNEIWPKRSSDINASEVCWAFMRFKILFRDMLSPNGTTKISHCPTLGWIIS